MAYFEKTGNSAYGEGELRQNYNFPEDLYFEDDDDFENNSYGRQSRQYGGKKSEYDNFDRKERCWCDQYWNCWDDSFDKDEDKCFDKDVDKKYKDCDKYCDKRADKCHKEFDRGCGRCNKHFDYCEKNDKNDDKNQQKRCCCRKKCCFCCRLFHF